MLASAKIFLNQDSNLKLEPAKLYTMKDCAESMKKISDIRKGIDHYELLTKLKKEQYRK